MVVLIAANPLKSKLEPSLRTSLPYPPRPQASRRTESSQNLSPCPRPPPLPDHQTHARLHCTAHPVGQHRHTPDAVESQPHWAPIPLRTGPPQKKKALLRTCSPGVISRRRLLVQVPTQTLSMLGLPVLRRLRVGPSDESRAPPGPDTLIHHPRRPVFSALSAYLPHPEFDPPKKYKFTALQFFYLVVLNIANCMGVLVGAWG